MERLESINPATGDIVGSVEITPTQQVETIIAKARAAQPAWEALGAEKRAETIARAASQLFERADELGELMTREMGKPLAEGIGEVKSVAKSLRDEPAEIAAALAAEVVDDGRTASTIYRDPYGVCAAITPWNFPMEMPNWMVLPALVAGNTVIFKPSEETPLVAQAYADALTDVLPEGVLQVVHGADDQGKALVAGDVDLIAFTGSREVGKKIMAAASGGLKRVILELGGKDPLLVLEGADLDRAAKFAANNSFRNAGQVCVSTERIFVEQSVAEDFVAKLVDKTATMTLGDGMEEGTIVGPMVNAGQKSHVVAQVTAAVAAGAEVRAGGGERAGNYVEPTVLVGVTDRMDIATEETFGPVACITVVESADAAVDAANRSVFGLGAAVFGPDNDATRSVARRLRAGMIGINKPLYGAAGTPWVGARESGYGFHKSTEGHRQFTQLRMVSEASTTKAT